MCPADRKTIHRLVRLGPHGGGTILVPNAPAPTASTSGGLPEIDSTSLENDGTDPGSPVARTSTNSQRGTKGKGANPALAASFDGLNFFDQRFANGGNQFSVEPPDQGLCVGNGKVVEVVNDVYQVFDTSGHPLINPVDLNTLFGYAPAITRSGPNAGQEGPDVFDPSCLFDQQTGRFFVVASTLDRVSLTNHADTGTSHIDILVGSDPTASLTKYSINTTSDAACFNDEAQTQPGPCFPDYPHIGADANGFYVTTNVFDFFGPGFEGVNIYAMSKSTLASGAFTVPVTAPVTLGVQQLDGNDSRIGGVSYANGKLWATLGTSATDSAGHAADGVAWYVLNPHGPGARLDNQGLLVKDGTDLTYPTIAAMQNGAGVLNFTITGPSDFPSAGYARLDAKNGTGDVKYAAHGAGPQDGFTEYLSIGTGSFRPRWGDYGAAAVDGKTVWVASEYIGQTCTLAQYVLPSPTNLAAFGTCNDTRGSIGNWDTRISQIVP